MVLRLLHLSDLHLERTFASLGCHSEQARRRRDGLRDSLRRLGAEAAARGCTAVTIGGDLYEDSRATASTGEFLADTFESWAPMRVIIAPGNHDPLTSDCLYARTAWPSNVHIFTGERLEPLTLAEGVTLWGLAHHEPAWMGNPLDCDPPQGEGIHLALFHGAELGSRPDGKAIHGPFRLAQVRERGFLLALCGHYHKRRIDLAGGLIYPGTPEPLDLDEIGPRGAVMVEVGDDGGVSVEPVDTNRWWSVGVRCDISQSRSQAAVLELLERAVANRVPALDRDRTLVRIDLDGDVAAATALDSYSLEAGLRDQLGLVSVRVHDHTEPEVDVEQARIELSARGAFARRLLSDIEQAGDEQERTLLRDALRYGLMALAGSEVGLR